MKDFIIMIIPLHCIRSINAQRIVGTNSLFFIHSLITLYVIVNAHNNTHNDIIVNSVITGVSIIIPLFFHKFTNLFNCLSSVGVFCDI